MIRFETVNELALKVTCQGGGVLYTKAGAFIAGESAGGKNYTFEKVLFGPQQGLLQAAFGALTRRMAGENLPLMKVNFGGDSQTYYANAGQHVTAYQLARGEVLSVEAENILAFTGDCDYNVRFLGMGVVSQKGIATSTLTGRGDSAFVAVLSDGNPLVMNNRKSRATISLTRMRLSAGWGRKATTATRRFARTSTGKRSSGRHPANPMPTSGAATSL